jgi:protein-tyrosine phosphatase
VERELSILFVCHGNICRSPMAEDVMRRALSRAGLLGRVTVSSAGVACEDSGRRPDLRARACIRRRRGNISDLRSRQLSARDLQQFDLILVMDRRNLADVRALASTDSQRANVQLLGDYGPGTEIADPAEDGPRAFTAALDAIEEACQGLLKQLTNELPSHLPSVAVEQ